MSIHKRRKKMYVIWVIISLLGVISMVGFLLAPLIRINY